MSSNFKNICLHLFSVPIDLILLKLEGNDDMHNILDEFEFRPSAAKTKAQQTYIVESNVFSVSHFVIRSGNEDMH